MLTRQLPIIEADGTSTTDFSALLDADVRLGPDNVVEAFSEICYSDILIKSNNGFSTLAGVLCPNPVVMMVQNWVHIPNGTKLRNIMTANG